MNPACGLSSLPCALQYPLLAGSAHTTPRQQPLGSAPLHEDTTCGKSLSKTHLVTRSGANKVAGWPMQEFQLLCLFLLPAASATASPWLAQDSRLWMTDLWLVSRSVWTGALTSMQLVRLAFFVWVCSVLWKEPLCFCSTGILTQMVSDEAMKPFGSTYIPSSYVKYVESGGSRALPIRWVSGVRFLSVATDSAITLRCFEEFTWKHVLGCGAGKGLFMRTMNHWLRLFVLVTADFVSC